MVSKEDRITNSLIENIQNRNYTEIIEASPEHHYNYYGTRGVADLLLKYKSVEETKVEVIEVKAELNNANEVIRQTKKMAEHFFRDKSNSAPYNSDIQFKLLIYPTEKNLEHIINNFSMYNSLKKIKVAFYHPEGGKQVEINKLRNPDMSVIPKAFPHISFEIGLVEELPEKESVDPVKNSSEFKNRGQQDAIR